MSQNIIPSGQSHLLTEFRSHHTTRAGLQWLTWCPGAKSAHLRLIRSPSLPVWLWPYSLPWTAPMT